MEPLFENYEEYKAFVHEMWELGDINELHADGLIVETEESTDYECESKQRNYRKLTEEEFNKKNNINEVYQSNQAS